MGKGGKEGREYRVSYHHYMPPPFLWGNLILQKIICGVRGFPLKCLRGNPGWKETRFIFLCTKKSEAFNPLRKPQQKWSLFQSKRFAGLRRREFFWRKGGTHHLLLFLDQTAALTSWSILVRGEGGILNLTEEEREGGVPASFVPPPPPPPPQAVATKMLETVVRTSVKKGREIVVTLRGRDF